MALQVLSWCRERLSAAFPGVWVGSDAAVGPDECWGLQASGREGLKPEQQAFTLAR